MPRLMLTDERWERIKGLLPGKLGARGCSGTENRLFLEAVRWLIRTGPPAVICFRNWATGTRFGSGSISWAKDGVWEKILRALAKAPDFEPIGIASSVIRPQQHGRGRKKGARNQAIGKSRGGNSTKSIAAVDGLDKPIPYHGNARLGPGL